MHGVLRNVGPEEFVLDSFSASLEKDIAIQGRIYLTQSLICFYSNILNLVTTVIVPFSELVSIQRKPSDIPRGILLQTKDSKVIFWADISDSRALFAVYFEAD